jgi:hypothetical protein
MNVRGESFLVMAVWTDLWGLVCVGCIHLRRYEIAHTLCSLRDVALHTVRIWLGNHGV